MLIKQMFTKSINLYNKRNVIKLIIPKISNNYIKKEDNEKEGKNKEVKKVFYPFFGWVFY